MNKRKLRCVFHSVINAMNTQIVPVSSRGVRILTASTEIAKTTAEVRNGNADAKRRLPAVCWAAKFEDGKRHLESASWTGLCYMDIDHIPEFYNPQDLAETHPTKKDIAFAFYTEKMLGREEELGIVHAQISPSGDGLHIVFIPAVGDGKDLGAAQAEFAQRADIEAFDTACKDMSRMLFLSPLCDTLYDALDTLYDD